MNLKIEIHFIKNSKPIMNIHLCAHMHAHTIVSILTLESNCKVHPRTGHDGPDREKRCSFTLSLTLALDWAGWSMLQPDSFTPGKETGYPLCKEAGWALESVLTGVENLAPPGFDPRTVNP